MTDVSKLWPGTVSPINHWGYLAGKLVGSTLIRPLLICARGVKPFESETHPLIHKPSYDDTGIFIYRGGQTVFAMASHAYQLDSKLSPDIDGDKRGDVGSIRPGRYTLTDKGIKPYPILTLNRYSSTPMLMADRIPCWRDTDHNGYISEEEAKRSEELRVGNQVNSDGCYADAVLMHTGYDAPADSEHKFSIACQTASLKYLNLIREKCAAWPTTVLDYVLMDAKDLLQYVMPEEIPDIVA